MPMRLAIIALLLAGTAAPALAQASDNSMPGRVDRLEKEMHAVQRKVFPGGNPQYFEPQIAPPAAAPAEAGSPSGSVVTDLSQRVSALEQQVQQLTNQAEENGHRLSQLEQQYTKLQGDTEFRLNALEGHGAAPAPQGAPAAGATAATPPFGPGGRNPIAGKPAPTTAPTRPPADSSASRPAPAEEAPSIAKTGDPAEDGYMLGYMLWTQKRYGDAEAELQKVVSKYPKHKRASYAQNLIGRAYLDDGQLSEAAKAFYASYKQFPRGERAPDSLYYLGVTLTKLKKNSDACQAYAEFQDVYGATANATLKAKVAQGRADAKCGA
ncbi:MAG TPA: tetratricopeptide repeat protein [Sphingomonas sp.]|nr:tetratricopeptide repeat protein [Sphingomonas sp.]